MPLFIAAVRANAAQGHLTFDVCLIAAWLGFGLLFGICLSFLNSTLEETWSRNNFRRKVCHSVFAKTTKRHRTLIVKSAFMGLFYWLQFMFLEGGTDKVILCIAMSMTFFLAVRVVIAAASGPGSVRV